MARVDLHLHTDSSSDSLSRVPDIVRRAHQVGLTHLAVTDHNTLAGALRTKEVSDLPVIVGEEIMTAQGEIIGLFLRELVPPGLTARQTAEAIHQQGGLVYVPHPTDPYRHGLRAEGVEQIRELVDVIEVFNARCVRPSSNAEALALAVRLPGVAHAAASDSHSPGEIGRSYVDGPDFADAAGLKKSLLAGRLHRMSLSPAVHLLSRYATLRRRLSQRPRP